jgi:hypothetical protein
MTARRGWWGWCRTRVTVTGAKLAVTASLASEDRSGPRVSKPYPPSLLIDAINSSLVTAPGQQEVKTIINGPGEYGG